MKVVLIRHGQTGGNFAKRHQEEGSHLTEDGRKQAAAAAAACTKLHPTHVITSPRVRTLETSQVIAKATGLIPETDALFEELCRPWRIYGNLHKSPASIFYMAKWFLGFSGGHDCSEAGESYKSFIRRLIKARTKIELLPEDAVVVVVSHSVFINFFLAHLARHSPLLWWKAPFVFKNIFTLKNGGRTTLNYNKVTDTWQVENFNQLYS